MFKFGIHKPQQLNRRKMESFTGRRKFMALDLYNRVPDGADMDYFQERILSRLAVANGTFKYTHARRFDSFDKISLEETAKNFKGGHLRVHDIGVSDGRTAVHFFAALKDIYGVKLDFTASDISYRFYVIRKNNSRWRIITDDKDILIQVIVPPFVFNITQQENKFLYPLNHIVRKAIMAFYVRPLLKNPRAVKEEIEIISSTCRTAAATGQFRFETYDIVTGTKGPFDVIRTMNLLNLSYFSADELKRIFVNITDSLAENGLLIAGSNKESGSAVDGCVYRKEGGVLIPIRQSGCGLAADKYLQTRSEEIPVMRRTKIA